jgi:hypothetical protein
MTDVRRPATLLTVLGASCLALFLAPAVCGAVTFAPHQDYATGSSPLGVAVADLDGDGNLDLAVANAGSNTVSVLLGDGTGHFGAATDFEVNSQPAAVVAADFDFDGNLDLAVADRGSDDVAILQGDGTGSFGLVAFEPVGLSPTSLAVGHFAFNSPGNDLVVANQGSDTVTRLRNASAFQGDFDFSGDDFPAGDSPTSVLAATLDSDCAGDLVVTNRGADTVSVLIANTFLFGCGEPTGSFDPPVAYGTGHVPVAASIANFNGGTPDLAVADRGSGKVSVLLGGASGGTFLPKSDYVAGFSPDSLVVGDFDGDLNPDVATANLDGDDVSVLHGNGIGGLGSPASFDVGRFPSFLAAGDFDGDGDRDLAVANQGSSTVSILLNGPADIAPPETTIDSGPDGGDTGSVGGVTYTNATSPSFTFSSSEASSTFECRMDGGSFAACDSGDSFGPLANGSHTFEVRATDPSSNTDPSADSATFTVAACTINGSAASQRIVDTGANDVICAGAGDDRVIARAGADIVFAGLGDDYVTGGGGNDLLLGGPGKDYLAGNGANDSLDGGAGSPDTCEGGRGTDVASPDCEQITGVP